MANTIQHKRGTAADWTSADPTLAAGQIGVETDTGKFKFGDGSTAWSALGYFETAAAPAAVFSPALAFTLDNPNAYGTSAGDKFGVRIATSDNYAIVGATGEDDAGGTDSGKAYIYNVTTGALLHTLDNPNAYDTSLNDTFGLAVAISDNYAIVGAYQEDDAGGSASGKAYIYNVTTGALLHTLDNPNAYGTSASDFFGASVAIDGDYAIVSARNESSSDNPLNGVGSGVVYIYNVTTGALLHTLDNPNPYGSASGDAFGYGNSGVSISGNYAIVGATGEAEVGSSGTNTSGAVYIYNVTTGALLRSITNPNAYGAAGTDKFGFAVAISGNYAIASAYNEDDAGGTKSGKAYIFDVTTGALLHILDNPNPDGTSTNDIFGYNVSISGNYAIVSGHKEADAGGTDSGKAYIFNVTTGALLHTLDNPNPYGTSQTDYFGLGVAISGNYAIVGASNEDDAGGTESGKVYIYSLYA